MADGSNIPTSMTDTIGMTVSERRAFNDVVVDLEQNNFRDNLDVLNYDGGFFDIFRDETKISSKSNVVVNIFDEGTTASRGNDNQTSTAGENDKYGLIVNPNKDLDGVKAVISNNTSDATTAYLIDDSDGTTLDTTDISSLSAGSEFELSAAMSSGKRYRIVLDSDGSGTGWTRGWYDSPSFPRTSTDIDIIETWDFGSTTTAVARAVNDVTALNTKVNTSVTLSSGSTSGSITSTQKDLSNDGFSNPPKNVVVTQDADIPADEDIQYVISDGGGNSVSVTQSEIDTEVDTSALSTTSVTVEVQLSSSDGNDTPTLRDYALHFAEGS